jgi:hypothetical protein
MLARPASFACEPFAPHGLRNFSQNFVTGYASEIAVETVYQIAFSEHLLALHLS